VSGLGHEEKGLTVSLNARCRMGDRTFVETLDNGRDAPIPVVLSDGRSAQIDPNETSGVQAIG
jgi:hypothetical protein